MKRLFRDRKLSFGSSSTKAPVTVSAPAPLAPSSQQDTPLFARFSTLDRRDASDGPSKPIVSAPMQLTSKASRTSISRVPASNGGGRSADRHSKVLTKKPSRVDARGQEQSYPQVLTSPESRSSHKTPPSAPPAAPRTSTETYRQDVRSSSRDDARRYEREGSSQRRSADQGHRRSSTADPSQGRLPFPQSAQVEQWDTRDGSSHSSSSIQGQSTYRPTRNSTSRRQSRIAGGDSVRSPSVQSQRQPLPSPGSSLSFRELQAAPAVSGTMLNGGPSRAAVPGPAQLSSRASRTSVSRTSASGAGSLTHEPSATSFAVDQVGERRRHDSRRSEDTSFSVSGSAPKLPLIAPRLSEIGEACTGDAAADVARFLALDAVFPRPLCGDTGFRAALVGAYAALDDPRAAIGVP